MNDYRQKFSVTNIQSAVMAGYGLEFAIPGCHTDIGDGLDTGGEFEEITINTKTNQAQKVLQWKHTSRDEKKVIIKRSSGWEQHLKQRPKLSPSLKSDRRFLPQVVDEEHLAEQQSCYADYDAIVQRLVDVGWGTTQQIKKENNWGFEFISLVRPNLSVNYPKISASLMLEWIKNYTPKDYFQTAILKRYFLEADSPPSQLQINPYPSAIAEHTVDDVNEIYQIFLHLRTKMLALSQQSDNNVKYVAAGELCDQDPIAGETHKREACYLYVTDENLRKRLYQHYLHWSTEVEVKGFKMMKEWVTKVNIGYINSKHRFYRKVYQG